MTTLEKLKKIRQLSNIEQALENLVLQCGDDKDLGSVKYFAKETLRACREHLKEVIHSHDEI